MTVTLYTTTNNDDTIICTVETEKYSDLFMAYVYEKSGDYYRTTHSSQPSHDKRKAYESYRRFIRKYINA